jgi:alkyl sulfatase BDS1-like metallo-beta-lactamase superfamily hydrolase
VLTPQPRAEDAPPAQATVTTSKLRLLALLGGDMASPGLDVGGYAAVLQELLGVLDRGDPAFNIVEP